MKARSFHALQLLMSLHVAEALQLNRLLDEAFEAFRSSKVIRPEAVAVLDDLRSQIDVVFSTLIDAGAEFGPLSTA